MPTIDWKSSETLRVVGALALVWLVAFTVALARLPLDGPTRLVVEEREKIFVDGLGEGAALSTRIIAHAHDAGFALDAYTARGELYRTAFTREGKRLSGPARAETGPEAEPDAERLARCVSFVDATLRPTDRGGVHAVPYRDMCLVGAPAERQRNGASTGAVYVVDPSGPRIVSRIAQPTTDAFVGFGRVIATDDAGELVLVSAQRAVNRNGIVHVFDLRDLSAPGVGLPLRAYDAPDDQHHIGRSLALISIDGRERPDANLHAGGLAFGFVGDPTDQEGAHRAGGAVTMFRITRSPRGQMSPMPWLMTLLLFGSLLSIAWWSASRPRR